MLVSVIIPTHNRAELISKALNSVRRQTYSNLEIIVVSDGSTDNTDEILNQYTNIDSRIKYISYRPNKGGNYARNIGIRNAKGKFIAFLDDDDEWLPEKIELQIKEFNKDHRIGLVYTGAEIIYNDKNISYYTLPKYSGDLSTKILISNLIGSTSSVMVKVNTLLKSGLFDENLEAQQDYDLWIRICQNTRVGAVSKPLLKYHNYISTNQISDNINRYIKSISYIEEKYQKLYDNVPNKIKTKHIQSSYIFLAINSLRNNNPKDARKYVLKLFKKKPCLKAIILYMASFLKYETLLRIRSLNHKIYIR